MISFTKRLSAPTNKTKWYATKNPFFNTKYSMFKKHPTTLGNCTHYAYGRASEILNKKSGLPTGNADKWFDKAKYKKGFIPYLGSIACYKHKNKSGGHLGVVEEIRENGDLLLSMSGWNSYLFKTRVVKKEEGYVYSDYNLQGFIYIIENDLSTYQKAFPKLPKRGFFMFGDKGKEVKKLQEFLNWANDASLNIDGIIGSKTKKEIINFQKKVGLKADGLFGKDTLNQALVYFKIK